jgi:hypothetical protein
MRKLGFPEMLIIFCIALLIWGPRLTERLRFNAPTATFNKTFFVVLTIILALFTLAELWLLDPSR